jgi:hypothetical protein
MIRFAILVEGSDEDIPTTQPSPPTIDDLVVSAKDKSNDEIMIGPITRARAKLLEQHVNSLLIESDVYYNGILYYLGLCSYE